MSPSMPCRASGFIVTLFLSFLSSGALAEPEAAASIEAESGEAESESVATASIEPGSAEPGSVDPFASEPLAADSGPTASGEPAQAALDERETRARVWQYGWGGTGYALAVGFGALAATTDDDDARLGFGFAAGGIFVDTTIHMLSSIHPNAASGGKGQGAVDRLRLAAEAEEHRRSLVFGHLLPAGFATAAGVVLWLGFGNLEGAAFNTAAAIVTNEVRILTQPTSAIDAWNAYRQGQGSAHLSPQPAAPRASLSLALTGAGCALVGSF